MQSASPSTRVGVEELRVAIPQRDASALVLPFESLGRACLTIRPAKASAPLELCQLPQLALCGQNL